MEMKSIEKQLIKITSIPEAVSFINSNFGRDITPVIEFLKKVKPTDEIPSPVTEFCLSIKDSYESNDSTTPVVILADLIEKLLKK